MVRQDNIGVNYALYALETRCPKGVDRSKFIIHSFLSILFLYIAS